MKASQRHGVGDAANKRRFSEHFAPHPESVRALAETNPAVVEGRTLFPTRVFDAGDVPRLLIDGVNQRKIGGLVTIGAWRGMPIYTLTLEERATCPRECEHWRTCYGGGMPFARRIRHDADLELLLPEEIGRLAAEHPAGFVIRLHILGDFYDAAYAALWHRWMAKHEGMRLFGYTARDPASDVGVLVRLLNQDFAGRCLIRFSGHHSPDAGKMMPAARTIWRMPEAARVPEGIVCPAQTDKTACCGSCGLCWTTRDPIVFIAHGRRDRAKAAA